jgi:hypothetical protein
LGGRPFGIAVGFEGVEKLLTPLTLLALGERCFGRGCCCCCCCCCGVSLPLEAVGFRSDLPLRFGDGRGLGGVVAPTGRERVLSMETWSNCCERAETCIGVWAWAMAGLAKGGWWLC